LGRDFPGADLGFGPEQTRHVIANRGKATRFEEKNRFAAFRDRIQAIDNQFRLSPRFAQETLRDERPPATGRPHEVDRTACPLQNLDRGEADLRIVVIGEGVVK